MPRQSIFTMKFARVYPLLVAKAEKKGRARAEVDEVTSWLTGYSAAEIAAALASDTDMRAFFEGAPCVPAAARLITGTICGVRLETIEDPLLQLIRRLDKLVDELAKGRPMEKIIRTLPADAKEGSL